MKEKFFKQAIIVLGLLLFGAFLLNAISEMPRFGEAKNPPNRHVIPRYIQRGEEESGAKNIITNIILNYRGYDTFGEVTVIFTALCSVLAVLKREDLFTSYSHLDISPVKTSIVVRFIITFLLPFILLFGFYVILHGEDTPGGGFQGGTIVAASFILFALVFGFKRALQKMPSKIRVFFENAGPLAFFVVGIIGLFLGLNFLSFMLPVLPPHYRVEGARLLLSLIEIGIGIGGGAIFTSIFFSMQREEG